MWKRSRSLMGGAMLLVVWVSPAIADSFTAQQLGIAVTPRNFPNHSSGDIDNAFALSRKLGNKAVFIYQWGTYDQNISRLMLEKTRQHGMVPVIGLSPTTLDQGRKELDIPATVRAQAGGNISFANPVIRNAFVKAARELANLKPEYLCLATEINLLGIQRLDEYLQFVTLYKEAYREVKRISPATHVFVSFQYEWIRILDAKEPARLVEHRKLIDVFRPEIDVVGLTTYPAEFHNSPLDLPADYYTWIFHHIPVTDKLVLMETGWPTQGSGSDLEQILYISRLPALLKGINIEVLAWALLHDVKLSEFGVNLNTVGLIHASGQFKPGLKAFDDLDQ